MTPERLIAYLALHDCEIDQELSDSSTVVIVNDVSKAVGQFPRDPFISAHTIVVCLRALNVAVPDELHDINAVLEAYEHSLKQQTQQRRNFPDRLN